MAASRSGSGNPSVCPHCGDILHLQSGGWAYVYTQVLLHLDRCARELTEHERQAIARAVVEARTDST